MEFKIIKEGNQYFAMEVSNKHYLVSKNSLRYLKRNNLSSSKMNQNRLQNVFKTSCKCVLQNETKASLLHH